MVFVGGTVGASGFAFRYPFLKRRTPLPRNRECSLLCYQEKVLARLPRKPIDELLLRSRRLLSYGRKCQKLYGSLIPIDRPGVPFHTVAMDFIVSLPVTTSGMDSLLTVTDKFSKRVLLLPGKTTFSASKWADVLLANLTKQGWGIPVATISDRDSKFMSELWQAIFRKLGTDILVSTAYHPQTDSQSERTNQSVEIALRYFVTANRGEDCTQVLPYLQGSFNNSKNQSTNVLPNEILYGFNVRDTLRLLAADLPPE